MKKILVLTLVSLLVVGLVLTTVVPVMAQDNQSPIVANGFTIDQSAPGYKIPRGSVIRYLENGITEAHRSDNSLILKSQDYEVAMVPTPSGWAIATHVITVPSGSSISHKGNVTYVYKSGILILEVIDSRPLTAPLFSGWIEQANNWDVNKLDYFSANWLVPFNPPHPGLRVVDFLFNAIEPQSGTAIIQPVLEWNQAGSRGWTLRSWYGPVNGTYYASPPVPAISGHSISGVMGYQRNRGWQITAQNDSTGESTSISTDAVGNNELAVFCALEGYNITGNKDVPGDTTFNNMRFGNGSINVNWNPFIGQIRGLTGLEVEIFSSSKVTLYTAN